MTSELRNQKDKNGQVIDFVFCFRCSGFLDMNDYEDGEEVICVYCHKGDKIS
jgi:hypothetical protein